MKIFKKSLFGSLLLLSATITFAATPKITLSDDGEIKRHNEDGEVITVNLSSDTFVASLNPANWTFSNLPEGVTISEINRISDTRVNLVLSGNATSNYSKSITNYTVTISNEELTALETGSISANTGVKFDASYWKLVWNDEFDGTGLPDNTKWSFEKMTPGTVNNELENYTENRTENARQEDGHLIIECLKDNYDGYPYSSARLITRYKGDWTYAKVVTSAKLPSGLGTWPAIWMMPSDNSYGGWPNSGEIDIMEHVGYDPGGINTTMHTGSYNHTLGTQKGAKTYVTDYSTAFHEYTVDWKPEFIDTYVDSNKYFTFNNEHNTYMEWPYDKRFFLILNIAYGGSWGGFQGIDDAIFSRPEGVKMYIDYVRIYKNIEDLIITGPSEVYPNDSGLTFTIEKLDGVTCNWKTGNNYNLTSKADSNAVNVAWSCGQDTIQVNLVVDGTEYYTISKVVKIKPYTIIGDNWIDANAVGELYTTQDVKGATYNWSASEGINIVSGQGTDSAYFDFTQEGNIYLSIENSCGIQYDTFAVSFGDGQFPYPEGSSGQSIPGKIYIANFDIGGEGVAYHDNDAANQGNVYRPNEGVDLESKDGSTIIGWSITGEWMEYTVNVAESKAYNLSVRGGGQNSGKISIYQDDNLVAENLSIPPSGSWTTFKTYSFTGINLTQGNSILKVKFAQGGCNLGNLSFAEPSGTNNIEIGVNIEIYPNPTSNILNFSIKDGIENGNEISVKIFSLDGELVLGNLLAIDEDKTLRIDVSMLPQGIYFLNLNCESRDINAKFFKL
jgi:beta-glucanase (GH16 family)